MTDNTTPRRPRWFQFSLRTMFALIILVGVYFAGFATALKLTEKAIRDARDETGAEMGKAKTLVKPKSLKQKLAEKALQDLRDEAAVRTEIPLRRSRQGPTNVEGPRQPER